MKKTINIFIKYFAYIYDAFNTYNILMPYPGVSLDTPVLWKGLISLFKQCIVIHLNWLQ